MPNRVDTDSSLKRDQLLLSKVNKEDAARTRAAAAASGLTVSTYLRDRALPGVDQDT